MELSDGTWKEIERVEKTVDDDFLQKEREFALEDMPKITVEDNKEEAACKESKDITECEPSTTNGAINNQTNGNAISKEQKV